MRRRAFCVASTFVLTVPRWALSQTPSRPARIGVVFYNVPLRQLSGPVPESPFGRALVEGLGERGWVDGKNAQILWRSSEGRHDRIPALVQELLDARVDILVASGNDIAAESVKRSPATPVVLGSSDFPVENGLVASLAKPGGSITGLTNWVGMTLDAKRLALLKETVPGVSRVAFLGPPYFGKFAAETLNAADSLGVKMSFFPVGRINEVEDAFESAVKAGANAIFVMDYPFAFVTTNQAAINRLALKHRLPAIHSASTAADSGALLTFAPDTVANFRRAGHYVDKILRGAKPADLPIEQPDKLDFVVNLRTAQAIGLKVPASILAQATRIID